MRKMLAILLLLVTLALPVGARTVTVTAYTAYENTSVMANGQEPFEGAVACDFLPLGTVIYLDGMRYVVLDRIGSGSYDHVDIFVNDYDAAIEFGVRYMELEVEG